MKTISALYFQYEQFVNPTNFSAIWNVLHIESLGYSQNILQVSFPSSSLISLTFPSSASPMYVSHTRPVSEASKVNLAKLYPALSFAPRLMVSILCLHVQWQNTWRCQTSPATKVALIPRKGHHSSQFGQELICCPHGSTAKLLTLRQTDARACVCAHASLRGLDSPCCQEIKLL